MRMARVNISIPDELLVGARAAGLNVSRLAASALTEELDRQAKITELENYLHMLEVELGPISAADQAAAQHWADRVFDAPAQQRTGSDTP